MNKSLYNIQEEYLELASILEDNGGEITEEIEDRLAINQEELRQKSVNYALVIRQYEGAAGTIKGEIDRLTALMKSKQATADRLKHSIKTAMELYGVDKIEGELCNLTLRKNAESVLIEDESAIPKKFYVKKTVETLDKKLIKDTLQEGEKVKGASLQRTRSVTIK